MKLIRLTIIKNHDDPKQDKSVTVNITDADAVLDQIAAGSGPLKDVAPALKLAVGALLANCGDTDKIEIGADEDGKLNPKTAIYYKGDGSGAKVPFSV